MGTTGFNTFFDFENQVDRKAHNRESDKVLIHQNVPPAYALVISVILFFFAVVFGGILILRVGLSLLVLGLLSLSAGYLYSGGPLPISRTPFGEIFAGGFLGSVLFFVVTLSQGVPISAEVILASLPSTIFIASILTVNNTCDISGDKQAGRKTLSILCGYKISVGIIIFEILLAYSLAFFAFEITTIRALILAAGMFLSLLTITSNIKKGFTHETKGPSMAGISKSFLLFTIFYLLSIIQGMI
jgi:1,4-dihydroxy-2-naphthoate octaprenyltransferase